MAISTKVLIFVNLIAVVLALVVLGLSLQLLYGGSSGIAALYGLPVDIFYPIIAFSAFVFFVSILGLWGTCRHSQTATGLFVIFDLLTASVLLIVAIFVLLYANGISTIPLIDQNASVIGTDLDAALLTQALQHGDVWLLTQQSFGCCGIDFEDTYDFKAHNMSDVNYTALLQSNSICVAGRTTILNLHQEHQNYSSAAQSAADAQLGTSFFCKDVIGLDIQKYTIAIGATAGAVVFLQLITAFAALQLLCRVTTNDGGFVKPPLQEAGNLAFGAPPGKGGPQVNAYAGGNHYT